MPKYRYDKKLDKVVEVPPDEGIDKLPPPPSEAMRLWLEVNRLIQTI